MNNCKNNITENRLTVENSAKEQKGRTEAGQVPTDLGYIQRTLRAMAEKTGFGCQ